MLENGKLPWALQIAARCAKLSVSAMVFFYDRARLRVDQIIGREKPGSFTVLNYHAVSSSMASHFLNQMMALSKLAKPVSAVRNPRVFPGTAYTALTFDDAFCSFARNAWPVLKELRIPVTIFVPTEYLGRQSDWVDYGGDNPVGEDVMSATMLLDIAADKLVDVGSHTATHADLVRLSDEAVREELSKSRETLERMLERRVESISFPYGSFGERELRMSEEAGYRYQFSVRPDGNSAFLRERLIGRVSVQPWDWPVEFRLKVLGAYRWLAIASNLKYKLWTTVRGFLDFFAL